MKKVSGFLYQVFGWGGVCVHLCWCGWICRVCCCTDYWGRYGRGVAIAVKAQWFPLVIKVASVSVGLGLIGMYCGKEEALSMAADKKEAEEDLKRNLEEARENKEQK